MFARAAPAIERRRFGARSSRFGQPMSRFGQQVESRAARARYDDRMAPHVNWLAVAVAAVSMFLVGGLWYSPLLFAKKWMLANGLTDEELRKRGGTGKIFGGAFALAFVSAANLGFFLGGAETTTAWGATAGALTAIWIVAAIGIVYLFERKPLALFFINAGYFVVALPLMGTILGAWR
jgi:hypothetical protein